jgi:uncharacterized membrane protein
VRPYTIIGDEPERYMSDQADRTFSSDFKRFFLRGLVILLPSVLTLWLIVMAYQFVDKNIAEPINRGVRMAMVNASPYFEPLQAAYDPTDAQIRSRFHELRAAGRRVPGDEAVRAVLREGIVEPSDRLVELRRQQLQLSRLGQSIPHDDAIRDHLRSGIAQPTDAMVDAYRDELFERREIVPGADVLRSELRAENIREWWIQRWYMNLIGLVLAIVGVYTAGRVLGGYFGRKIYQRLEKVIISIPIFKQVYPSVKQVVDFLFSDDQPMKFNRVVVTEYPRKGIWSVGFLTGPTLRSVAEHAGDAVTIFIPSSPTPFTGYTITVPKSEVIEVPLTVDDAIRFAVSGGVLIPDHQQIRPGMRIKGRLMTATEGETIPLVVATGATDTADTALPPGRDESESAPAASTSTDDDDDHAGGGEQGKRQEGNRQGERQSGARASKSKGTTRRT